MYKKLAPSDHHIIFIQAHEFNGAHSILRDVQLIQRCTVHLHGSKSVGPLNYRVCVCVYQPSLDLALFFNPIGVILLVTYKTLVLPSNIRIKPNNIVSGENPDAYFQKRKGNLEDPYRQRICPRRKKKEVSLLVENWKLQDSHCHL